MNPFEMCEHCPHPTVEEFCTFHHLVELLGEPKPKEEPWLKPPKTGLGRFAFCLIAELISFFVIASNFRALARGLYVWTGVTDGLCVLQSMLMTKLMIENVKMRDWWSTRMP